MGISIDQIHDPRVRARYEEALRSGVAAQPKGSAGEAALKNPAGGPSGPVAASVTVRPARLISQSHKPVLNKLEVAALAWLMAIYPSAAFHSQAWRVKIGNGAWFKVDLCAFLGAAQGIGRWYAWEVKELRGKNAARGILALKTAAHQFPEVRWCLLVRQKGVWREQEVLP